MQIPFNKPYLTGKEQEYVTNAIQSRKLSGNREYTKKCEALIQSEFAVKKAFLTPSCTSALEMAAILIDIGRGDEVIMPSYTFSSTANAISLRDAKPIFIDIKQDTFTMDEDKIEQAITDKTKAIFPINYGGISPDMDRIMQIAEEHNLVVVEDAAQGVNAKYKGKFVGSIPHMAAYSFHETKNYSCGEGGALVINDEKYIKRAEIIQEKGTDRSQVIRGEKDKYSWVDLGSSFLLSDILAAFLLAQLEEKDKILELRKNVYDNYTNGLKPLIEEQLISIQKIPEYCESNYHAFYILLKDELSLDSFLQKMRENSISAYIGYVPLHMSPMGGKYGYGKGDIPATESVYKRIARLPFYADLTNEEVSYVTEKVKETVWELSK